MDCSPPSSSVHGILQARILEWVVIPFSRGSSQPRNWTWVFHTAVRSFTVWAAREACAYRWNPLTQHVTPVCVCFYKCAGNNRNGHHSHQGSPSKTPVAAKPPMKTKSCSMIPPPASPSPASRAQCGEGYGADGEWWAWGGGCRAFPSPSPQLALIEGDLKGSRTDW